MNLSSELVVQIITGLVTTIAVLVLLIRQFLPTKKSGNGVLLTNNPSKYDLSEFVNDCTKDHAEMKGELRNIGKTLERIEDKIGKS